MFTFAPGFEAATLKLPPGTLRRDGTGTSALLDQLQSLAAARAAAAAGAASAYNTSTGSSDDQSDNNTYLHFQAQMAMQQSQMEEALATLSLGGTASTSSATTPSAAMSMTPSAPSGPLLGVLGQGYPVPGASGANTGTGGSGSAKRRQTIGFARFKTRADALAAREVLQGKRIDSIGAASTAASAAGGAGNAGQGGGASSTLKAEMANKNLHAKRGVPSGVPSTTQNPASVPAGQEELAMAHMLRSGRMGSMGGYGAMMAQLQQGGRGAMSPTGQAQFQYPPQSSQGQAFAPSSAVSAKEAWDAYAGPATSDPSYAGQVQSGRDEEGTTPNSAIPIPGSGRNMAIAAHQRGSTSLSGSGSASGSVSASASASASGPASLATPSSAPNGLHGLAGLSMNPLHPVRSNLTNGSVGSPGVALSPIQTAGFGAGGMGHNSTKSPASRAADSKALLALAEEQDEMDWSIGMGLGMGMGVDDAPGAAEGYTHRLSQGHNGEGLVSMSGGSRGQGPYAQGQSQGPTSPSMSAYTSPLTSSFPGAGAGAGAGSAAGLQFGQQHGMGHGPSLSMLLQQGQGHGHGHGQGQMQGYVPGYAPTQGSDALSDAGGGLGRLGNPADQNPPVSIVLCCLVERRKSRPGPVSERSSKHAGTGNRRECTI